MSDAFSAFQDLVDEKRAAAAIDPGTLCKCGHTYYAHSERWLITKRCKEFVPAEPVSEPKYANQPLTLKAMLGRSVDCDAPRLDAAFRAVVAHIEQRYGIRTCVADVPDPFTGDLDGESIYIDYDLSAEESLFILVHLVGHTVQWNTDADERAIGLFDVTRRPSPELLDKLVRYEQKAAQYGLQLLHDVGVTDLDGWLADMAACDLAYLVHFYQTGEKKPFFDFWQSGTPPITKLAIPAFTPQRWATRSGTVI